jgi:hypothetical protein
MQRIGIGSLDLSLLENLCRLAIKGGFVSVWCECEELNSSTYSPSAKDFSPMAFRQGNMDGFDILATDVARAIPGGSKVCELYAGVGLLGLTSLVHHAQPGEKPLIWVRCSDENPANPRCFSRSVNSL